MPLVPSGVGSPFPTIGDVMNTARQRINDMQNDASGDLLTDDAPYAQTVLTDAWTWLQDQCADHSIEVATDEVTLYGVPARVSDDVSLRSYVSWQGCGQANTFQLPQPALPLNVIMPLSVARRYSGSTGGFSPMHESKEPTPTFLDCSTFKWQANALYFYGDTQAQDIYINFAAYLPQLDVTMPNNPVPIRGTKECLGARIAYYFTNARVPGGAGATSLEAMADKAFADAIAGRTSKRKQRMTVQRKGFSNRGHYGNSVPMYRNNY